jgi:hypothetical protein
MGKQHEDDQERIFGFAGDELELESPPMLFCGIQQTGHSIWQRI